MITNEILEKLIEESPNGVSDDLETAFADIGAHLIESQGFQCEDAEDLIQECVLIGFEKLSKYQSKNSKCKAWNYFTTSMLCHLRQLCRKPRRNK